MADYKNREKIFNPHNFFFYKHLIASIIIIEH